MTEEQVNPNVATAKDLQPTFATSNPSLLGTNLLHEIDQAAQVGAGNDVDCCIRVAQLISFVDFRKQ